MKVSKEWEDISLEEYDDQFYDWKYNKKKYNTKVAIECATELKQANDTIAKLLKKNRILEQINSVDKKINEYDSIGNVLVHMTKLIERKDKAINLLVEKLVDKETLLEQIIKERIE